ncbi:monooxygenase family protein [Fictibacillus barbaricus]|nr:DUF4188 domain-containing protein [Fictibacillus barbaricus]
MIFGNFAEFHFSWKRITLIQYWRSFEQLEAYAHGKNTFGCLERI